MLCTKILEPLKEILSFGKRKKLSNIVNRNFETLNNMQMGVDISFEDFLNQLNLDFPTYIDSLCNKLTKPTFFFKKTHENIRTNAYAIKATTLWEANTDIQFILDPYVAPSYCTSYFTLLKLSPTNFKPLLKNVKMKMLMQT